VKKTKFGKIFVLRVQGALFGETGIGAQTNLLTDCKRVSPKERRWHTGLQMNDQDTLQYEGGRERSANGSASTSSIGPPGGKRPPMGEPCTVKDGFGEDNG
jgi:hypothetical protein